ncbi:MAG: hypothetical protein ACI4UU_03545 [Clostridia bacterium]
MGLTLLLVSRLIEDSKAKMQEIFMESSQEHAIMELYEIRGRVEQISTFDIFTNISDSTLMSELKRISSFQNSINPFLKDFSITVTSSEVRDVCEEIIQQIDDQINTIKFGAEDA